jgi:NADPH:quinone reductase-like Zn-dependent oxidoreductase
MKAVRIYEYGGPEKLIFENDAPDPVLGSDSVLIETAATSVNPFFCALEVQITDLGIMT